MRFIWFFPKEKNEDWKKVQDELNNVKAFLYEQNIKGFGVEETISLINEYIGNNRIELVLLMRKLFTIIIKSVNIMMKKTKKYMIFWPIKGIMI